MAITYSLQRPEIQFNNNQPLPGRTSEEISLTKVTAMVDNTSVNTLYGAAAVKITPNGTYKTMVDAALANDKIFGFVLLTNTVSSYTAGQTLTLVQGSARMWMVSYNTISAGDQVEIVTPTTSGFPLYSVQPFQNTGNTVIGIAVTPTLSDGLVEIQIGVPQALI